MKFRVVAQETTTVSKLLGNRLDVSLFDIKRQIKAREVRVDGVRIDTDRAIDVGAEVEIFVPERMLIRREKAYAVYADEHIVVAYKYADTPIERVPTDLERTLYPVHRLDRNTAGLVVFAVDRETEHALCAAVKARAWEKRYFAEVIGDPGEGGTRVAYLKKEAQDSFVRIADRPQSGYVEIITQFEPICRRDSTTVVDVGLITGRTHQIRAYFAHIGHPIVGDGKYGDAAFNRSVAAKYPHLTAYRLVLNGLSGELAYLNGKIFEMEKRKVDFIY
ncbi:MAG: RluA family pseudouridine synthase [Clostridia bacterium]|jgi:23S rRNA pseudouridine955/2504/2580 synthase|nr:RluA family pseudouridine synthase [Clostridia bacterium]